MKNFCLFLFFIIITNTKLFGQEFNVSYLYDFEETIDSISIINQNFKPYKQDINNGLKNGVYWFRIEIKSPKEFVLEIENSRITKVYLYLNNEVLPKVKKRKFITYKLSKATYYLKVITEKEGYIPIKIQTTQNFEANTTQSLLINGLYYGFAIMILIINLFYFINFRQVSFIKYVVFNIAINLSVFYNDGLFLFFISNPIFNSNIEVVLHALVAVFGSVFAIDYLSIRHKAYVRLLYSTLIFLLIAMVFYFITKQFLFFVFVECLCLLSLMISWFYGFRYFKKSYTAKIFSLAYFVIFIAAVNFYLFRLLGLPIFSKSIYYLKLGSVLEMLLFTYALVYRMKGLKHKNKEMQKQVSLYSSQFQELSQTKITAEIEHSFNTREKQIFKLLKQQKTNIEIAEELYISVNTVKYHLKNIYKKLHIKNRKEITNNLK